MEGFGTRLKAARILANFKTTEDFARNLGIEVQRYRQYERGRSFPPLDVLELICVRLPISTDYLLFGYRIDRGSPIER